MSAYSYGWEKLHLAIHSLTSAGSQKQRLIDAVAFNLSQINPERDLPPELRNEFDEFMVNITSVTAKGDEGTIQATIDQLDEIETSQYIDKIISFYDTVCHHRTR